MMAIAAAAGVEEEDQQQAKRQGRSGSCLHMQNRFFIILRFASSFTLCLLFLRVSVIIMRLPFLSLSLSLFECKRNPGSDLEKGTRKGRRRKRSSKRECSLLRFKYGEHRILMSRRTGKGC
jgi:hypothetical protein